MRHWVLPGLTVPKMVARKNSNLPILVTGAKSTNGLKLSFLRRLTLIEVPLAKSA